MKPENVEIDGADPRRGGLIPVVYTAGPFRGQTTWDVECNVRAMEEIALDVAKTCAMPLCPHANSRFFDGQLTGKFWVEGTLELLRRCDAIILHPRWNHSKGSIAERAEAVRLRIPIFNYPDDLEKLRDWVTKWMEVRDESR